LSSDLDLLVEERLKLVAEFSYYKYSHDLPIEDRSVEYQLEDHFLLECTGYGVSLERARCFLQEHFKASKSLQKELYRKYESGERPEVKYSLEEYRIILREKLFAMASFL